MDFVYVIKEVNTGYYITPQYRTTRRAYKAKMFSNIADLVRFVGTKKFHKRLNYIQLQLALKFLEQKYNKPLYELDITESEVLEVGMSYRLKIQKLSIDEVKK